MYETFLENEREFDEKFPEVLIDQTPYEVEYRADQFKSHNRLSLIKVMKALEKELKGEKKMVGTDIQDISPTSIAFNQALQLAIDKIENFINKIQ